MSVDELFKRLHNMLNSIYTHTNYDLLTEDARGAICREVKISYTGSACIYKFDLNGPSIFPYFNDLPKVKVMCDYIIFLKHGNSINVLICSLKSNKKNIQESKEQLKAGYLFSRFILSTAVRSLGSMEIPAFVQFAAIHISSIVVNNTTNSGKKNKKNKLKNKICNGFYLTQINCKQTFYLNDIFS